MYISPVVLEQHVMKKIVLIAAAFSFLSFLLAGCATVESPNKKAAPSRQKSNPSVRTKKATQKPQSRPGVYHGDREVSDDF